MKLAKFFFRFGERWKNKLRERITFFSPFLGVIHPQVYNSLAYADEPSFAFHPTFSRSVQIGLDYETSFGVSGSANLTPVLGSNGCPPQLPCNPRKICISSK